MRAYMDVAVFLLAGMVLVGAGLAVAWLLRPHRPYPDKNMTYECGEPQLSGAWVPFNIRFYIFALMFVVFDVETVFLYPWAVLLRTMPTYVFFEIVTFIGIVVLGLVYAWKKRVLTWL